MKNLYAYSDAMESRIETVKKTLDSDSVEEIKALLDGDPYEMTFGEVMLKVLSEAFGIPMGMMNKRLVDLTIGEVAILDDIEDQCMIFSRN